MEASMHHQVTNSSLQVKLLWCIYERYRLLLVCSTRQGE
jgi:hypothetical protein